MSASPLTPVGKYKAAYNKTLNIALPCADIFRSDGLYKHVQKRHPECIKYLNKIPDMINNPDYIGTNAKENNSIEFVKCYTENVLVAVKLDIKDNYLYVASCYTISSGKLQRRVNNNRLKKPWQTILYML